MKRFLFWSLQQQLFFIIVMTLTPSLLLYAFIAEGHFLAALDKQFNQRLALISQQAIAALPLKRLSSYSTADINTSVYNRDLETIKTFVQTHQLDRLTITDNNHRICIDSSQLLPGSLFAIFPTSYNKAYSAILYQTKDGEWLKSFMIPLDNQFRLFLSAGSQMIAVVHEARWRRNITLLIGGLLAMLTSWFFIFILSKRLSKLTQGFAQLQAGSPNPRIKVSGHDEIAFLAKSFNETVDKLDQRQQNIAIEHEQRLSDMKILSAGVAHEIRNPLTGISGMIDLIDRNLDFKNDADSVDLIARTRQEIARMDIIIKDMMEYARQPNIHLTKSTLPDLLESIIKIDPQCKLQMTRPLPQLLIDPPGFKTVLRNLLINAREATGPKGTVILGTRLTNKYLFIYVKDNGPGIPIESRSKLFTPFYSSKNRGSGLGLSIASNIIKAHNGRLSCRSTTQGSLFIISFNLSKEQIHGNFINH